MFGWTLPIQNPSSFAVFAVLHHLARVRARLLGQMLRRPLAMGDYAGRRLGQSRAREAGEGGLQGVAVRLRGWVGQ
eukprot:5857954-Pleurochrysis_carterae.AAC.1